MNVIYLELFSLRIYPHRQQESPTVITEPLKTAIKTQAHSLLSCQSLDECVQIGCELLLLGERND